MKPLEGVSESQSGEIQVVDWERTNDSSFSNKTEKIPISTVMIHQSDDSSEQKTQNLMNFLIQNQHKDDMTA